MATNMMLKMMHGNIKQQWCQVIYQNIPGTCKNIEISNNLDILITKYSPQILFVGEADADIVSTCTITNYTFVRGTCHGVAKMRMSAFVRKDIKFDQIDVDCEIPLVCLRVGDWKITGVYREWAFGGDQSTRSIADQEKRFTTFMNWWSKLNGKNITIGDFNFNALPSDSVHQINLNSIRDSVAEKILCKGWTQLITKPTRDVGNNQAAALDHIYVSHARHVSKYHNFNVIHSDHNMVGLEIDMKNEVFESQAFMSRNLKKIKKGEFENLLYWYKMDEIYSNYDLDTCVDMFNHKILAVLNKLAPERRVVTRRHFAAWLTPDLVADMDRRDELRRVATDTGEWTAYKKFRNEVRTKLRQAKTSYLKEFYNDKDSKTRWSRIQVTTGLSKKSSRAKIELNTPEHGVLKNPKETSKYLNNYFREKVRKLKERTNLNLTKVLEYTELYLSDKKTGSFSFRNTDWKEVFGIISGLKNTSCVGVDGIPTEILKRFKHLLAGPLVHICNLALTQSKYPKLWKIGIVSPIPKSGDLSLPQNWRPVVLNCIPSKILETLINQQLKQYLERFGLISSTQHAYRKNKSCSSAWQELDTFVSQQREKGRFVALILTDQTGAFNVLDKNVLVEQLRMFGCDRTACKLIDDYLTGRATMCMINGVMSDLIVLDSGVGEGSVLGPTLYTTGQITVCVIPMLTMDIVKSITYEEETDSTSIEFADDCSGLVSAKDEETLQTAVNVMMDQYERYFSASGLALNLKKSNLIVFRPKPKNLTLTMNDIDEVEQVKLLGITVKNDYSFKWHANDVKRRVNYKCSRLANVADKLTDKNLRIVAEAHCVSIIGYGNEIWCSKLETQKLVQKCLNNAARLATRGNLRSNVERMLQTLNWPNATNQHLLVKCCSVKRLLSTANSKLNFSQLDLFRRHDHDTRARGLQLLWKARNKFGYNSFLQTAVKIYNDLRLLNQLIADDEFIKTVKGALYTLNGNGNL